MESICRQIIEAARDAGDIIRMAQGHDLGVREKEGRVNFVTTYDKKVQNFLTDALRDVLPGSKFLGEENGMDAFLPGDDEGWLFVIDPIDGTTNFMHGMHPYVTSIGLFLNGTPYAGVVYCPFTDQMFSAVTGKGAFENDVPIHSSAAPLEESLVIGGTSGFSMEAASIAQQLSYELQSRCHGIRSTGCAEYNLCMVASGRSGIYYELKLGLWDFAAGSVILQEAGGKITGWYGEKLSFRGGAGVVAMSEGIASSNILSDTGKYMDMFRKIE